MPCAPTRNFNKTCWGSEMSKPEKLTDDQQERIKATLARIRGGLAAMPLPSSAEPAHFFQPERFDVPRT